MVTTTTTIENAETDHGPILDPKSQEQLRMELYGTGLLEEPLVSKQAKSTNGGKNNNNTNLTNGMLVIGGSMLGLIGMQFPFLFIKHAPFMATPARKIRHALRFINDKQRTVISGTPSASLTPRPSPPIFVDLGSGDGQAVYEAAKLGYKAVGIEFNWTLWAFSSLRRQFFWPLEVKR